MLQSVKVQKNIHLIILSFLGLAIAIFIGYYFIAGNDFVPERFTEARQESVRIAKDIVSLTEESINNLEKIAEADREYRFGAALSMVDEESERIKEAQQKAVELTKRLEIMARSAVDISPKKARDMAIEAISSELSLISHLMVYNNMLSGLFQTLEYKFSGDIVSSAEEVQNLIKNMNIETSEINNLSNLYNEKMKEFDRVFQ